MGGYIHIWQNSEVMLMVVTSGKYIGVYYKILSALLYVWQCHNKILGKVFYKMDRYYVDEHGQMNSR